MIDWLNDCHYSRDICHFCVAIIIGRNTRLRPSVRPSVKKQKISINSKLAWALLLALYAFLAKFKVNKLISNKCINLKGLCIGSLLG